MHQQLKLEPYAVHTTFQYAGTEGKRHRLREGMLFYDQPEYYDSPGDHSMYGVTCLWHYIEVSDTFQFYMWFLDKLRTFVDDLLHWSIYLCYVDPANYKIQ